MAGTTKKKRTATNSKKKTVTKTTASKKKTTPLKLKENASNKTKKVDSKVAVVKE